MTTATFNQKNQFSILSSQKEIDDLLSHIPSSSAFHLEQDERPFVEDFDLDSLSLKDGLTEDILTTCESSSIDDGDDDTHVDIMSDSLGVEMKTSSFGEHSRPSRNTRLGESFSPNGRRTVRYTMSGSTILKDFVEFFGGTVYHGAKKVGNSLASESKTSHTPNVTLPYSTKKYVDNSGDGSDLQSFLIGYPLIFFFNLILLVLFGFYPA